MIGPARELHPVAWWLWAIGLAAYASQTTNPWLLLTLIAIAVVVVAARRTEQPWAKAFRYYLIAAAFVVALRVAFRIVLGGGVGSIVWLDLPEIPLPDWVLGISLFGSITQESVLAGLYDGLRLAGIMVAVGAANALANPKRLLRSLPPALYEIGTALVVAVTVLPQLGESLQRVRRAQQLRESHAGRAHRMRRIVVPVLEGALERSLSLAAGMDTRGYGRTGPAAPGARRLTGLLLLVGLGGLCVGAYAVLDPTFVAGWAAGLMLAAGGGLAVLGLVVAGRRVERTIYRPVPWRAPELLVVASGVVTAVGGWLVGHHQPESAYPSLTEAPFVTLTGLLTVVVGVLPAVVAPMPSPTELPRLPELSEAVAA
ncbi:energy-coupling factor transporter transmembrane component T [Nocardioides sp. Kera G14]|uniref:energy-coupling factor transporter transmembrane component T n=1 Tax=Nocardioides sp. Kera G14 TaxID=2884264 RepID=UPI001D10C3EF|nr:energy-coupling factor transporter transmembrane component T [Nocardioides sp. Kera G14]UDY24534.1 energy-coupling factor transporter transmembrane protein EcfT [Nocardioides sp. Kera G14]